MANPGDTQVDPVSGRTYTLAADGRWYKPGDPTGYESGVNGAFVSPNRAPIDVSSPPGFSAQDIKNIPIVGAPIERVAEGVGLIAPENQRLEETYNPTVARTGELYGRALAEEEAARAFGTPQIEGTQVAPVERLATPQGVRAGEITAGTRVDENLAAAAPVERYTTTAYQAPREVALQQIDTGIPASALEAERAGGTQVGRAGATGLAENLRAEQIAAAQRIGQGPSAAAAQFQAALGGITEAQLGTAAQARGAERAGARREAILGIGRQGIEAASASAAEAAREQQAKLVGASAALSGVRGTDVQSEIAQRQLSQQANNLQAEIDRQTAAGNQQQANALKTQLAQLQVQARTAEVGAGLTQARTGAEIQQGNIERQTAIELGNITRGETAAATGAAAANAAAQAEAARRAAIATGNVERGVETQKFGVTAGLEAGKFTAAAQNLADIENQRAANAAAQQQATIDAARKTAQAQATLQAEQQRRAAANAALGTAGGATTTGLSAEEAQVAARGGQVAREQAANERLVKFGSAALAPGAAAPATAALPTAAATSDERAKRDVSRVSDKELEDLAHSMSAVTFRYKPGFEDNGERRHAGVMAQDLEETPLGRGLVSKGDDGIRHVDYDSLAALMAAAAARSMRKHGTA